jgi:hypothetical protein
MILNIYKENEKVECKVETGKHCKNGARPAKPQEQGKSN